MALTTAGQKGQNINSKVRVVRVTFDNSYPTGGEAVTPSQLGFKNVHNIIPGVSTNGYVVTYDKANAKLKVFRGGAAVSTPFAEVPNATDLSTVVVDLTVYGF